MNARDRFRQWLSEAPARRTAYLEKNYPIGGRFISYWLEPLRKDWSVFPKTKKWAEHYTFMRDHWAGGEFKEEISRDQAFAIWSERHPERTPELFAECFPERFPEDHFVAVKPGSYITHFSTLRTAESLARYQTYVEEDGGEIREISREEAIAIDGACRDSMVSTVVKALSSSERAS